jgi:hypothetical protein
MWYDVCMSEIIVNMEGTGKFSLVLDIVDPGTEESETEVWKAAFCDETSGDCELVFFEMFNNDYEAWDLIDAAIQTYRQDSVPE